MGFPPLNYEVPEPEPEPPDEPVPEHSLAYLRQIYRDRGMPQYVRIRAATAALPYENPKLSVTANLSAEGFGSRLEEMMRRMGKSPTIGATVPALPAPRREDGGE